MYPSEWKNPNPASLERLKLHFNDSGSLIGEPDSFYPEIFLSFTIPTPTVLPETDHVLIDAAYDSNGWKLLLTMQGHLRLVRRSDGKTILETGYPAAILDTPELHIELVISNLVWPLRFTDWTTDDPLDYSRAEVFVNRRMLSDINMREPDLAVVPLYLTSAKECSNLTVYNSVRRDLTLLPDDPDGPAVDTDFLNASRIFTRYDEKTGVLHLFTGSEFIRSDSYWLLCRIATKGGLVRIHPTEFQAAPGMAPAFFRSADRKTWLRCKVLESTDKSGRNRPLIMLPEGTWYLSSSIPFMKLEQDQLFEKFGKIPDFEVKEIGRSAHGHPISMIRAGHGSYQVFFTIGQHSPMEMIGCHILDSLLERFSADPELRETITLYAVPPVNMDAAVSGSDGWNGEGWNTNRCWFKDLQPETIAVEQFLVNSGIDPDLMIDWHAGGVWRGHSVLWFSEEIIEKYAGQNTSSAISGRDYLLKLLEDECGFRKTENYSIPFRNCCAHDWFQVHFPKAVSITVELSVTTCFDPEKQHYIKVDQDSIIRCGRAMANVLSAMRIRKQKSSNCSMEKGK